MIMDSVYDSQKDKVLPCPFCKKENNVNLYSIGDKYFTVSCYPCIGYEFEYSPAESSSRNDAIKRWNHRGTLPRAEGNFLFCPFCGENVVIRPVQKHEPESSVKFICRNCGASSVAFDKNKKDMMISLWKGVV